MALQVGSRLGHYNVTALIGEGGMGEVYQATDTKLNRQVALKILPKALASDPDRLGRIQRSARGTCQLQGPYASMRRWGGAGGSERKDCVVRLRSSIRTLLSLALWLPSAVTVADEKTNVILIMADDIGYEAYGAFGGTSYQTPVLDRIAAEGMLFNHAYSNPVCAPSRVKIMTGLSNVRNYVSFSILRKTEKTFGHMMQGAGYRTAIAGKWQLYGAEHYEDMIRAKGSLPKDAGFDRHALWQVAKSGSRYWGPTITIDGELKRFGEDVYGPDIYTQFLLDRMDEYKDEPFFLYYPMALVHWPFVPTPDSADRHGTDQQQNFADMVAYMDKLIGRIVDKAEELGIADRTLILMTGDNGTYGGGSPAHQSIQSRIGDGVIVGGKGKTTDAGTRVGLFAYQPGTVPAGKVSNDLIDFADFLPTIADATGATPLRPTDGRSFLPQLQGQRGNPRETIYVYNWPRPEKGQPRAFVRNQRWKLYSDGRLFDIKNDVQEERPLIGAKTVAIRNELQAALDRMPAKGEALLRFD